MAQEAKTDFKWKIMRRRRRGMCVIKINNLNHFAFLCHSWSDLFRKCWTYVVWTEQNRHWSNRSWYGSLVTSTLKNTLEISLLGANGNPPNSQQFINSQTHHRKLSYYHGPSLKKLKIRTRRRDLPNLDYSNAVRSERGWCIQSTILGTTDTRSPIDETTRNTSRYVNNFQSSACVLL